MEIAHAAGADAEEYWAKQELIISIPNFRPEFPKYSRQELDLQPVNDLVELAVGLLEENNGKPKDALAVFEKVAKRNPRLALAHLLVAQQYERTVGPGYMPARVANAKAAKTTEPLWIKEYSNGVNVKKAAQKRLDKLAESAYMDGDTFVPAKVKKETTIKSVK